MLLMELAISAGMVVINSVICPNWSRALRASASISSPFSTFSGAIFIFALM